ncbi:hypothetical protein ACU045_03910 [Microbacterium sp. MAHUQ-60]|uniref:hypothetical protein n=1 Tax=unclassified Microbacterium TaxID=2609290 RepID=UPI00360EB14A
MSETTYLRRRRSHRTIYVAIAMVATLTIAALVYAHESIRDSDGDGLADSVERTGWATVDGQIFPTDPQRSDTDGDGLTDAEEAGELIAPPDGKRTYAAVSNPTKVDTDADGLDDRFELSGWRSDDGRLFVTKPKVADSDGDGLRDGDEAGVAVKDHVNAKFFALYSNPLKRDSDDDGLTDGEEADESLDPFQSDTDNDGLTDSEELQVIGTAAGLSDTDGDGLDDAYEVANRENRGLDPLRPDTKLAPATVALELAKGALGGEATPGDSVAWLTGNLVAGSTSLVPGVGWIPGTLADLRDAIASSIRADWIGAGYSMTGMIPAVGDTVAVPLKIARFLVKHPKLVREVSQMIARADWIPEGLKIKALASPAPEAWDALSHSTSAVTLLTLAQGGVNLKSLADDIARDNHLDGTPAPFVNSLSEAEAELDVIIAAETVAPPRTDVVFSTRDCGQGCNPLIRQIDVLAAGIAHEAKVGYVAMSPSTARQIRSDAYLIESGQVDGAQWHFFASSGNNSVGASTAVLSLLEELDIKYTIHLPR